MSHAGHPSGRALRTGLGWNAKSSWMLDREKRKKKNSRSGKNLRFLAFEWSALPGCHKWLRKWTPRRFSARETSSESPPPVVLVTASPPPKPPRISTRRPAVTVDSPPPPPPSLTMAAETEDIDQPPPVGLMDTPSNKSPSPGNDDHGAGGVDSSVTCLQLEEAKKLWRYWQSLDDQVRRVGAIFPCPKGQTAGP